MKPGKMHGFLCQSNASTAVCLPGDRSVVVPRRPDRTLLVDHSKLIDLKYSRLVESRRFSTAPPADSVEKKMAIVAVPKVPRREKRNTTTTIANNNNNNNKSNSHIHNLNLNQSKAITTHPPPPTTYGDVFQVVVMRVSIHCQGCAGKVKRHISRMEGVTSFSIDLENKRVTVMGHISPLGVLESISKVKKAEFWQAKMENSD